MTLLPHEVSHQDVTTLCDADAEQINEHNHVGTVGSRGQCLVADFIDEVGDDYL